MKMIFYGNRNTGQLVLSYLVAKGHDVKVITEDEQVLKTAGYYNLHLTTFKEMGDYDLFICCHGKKIICTEYLRPGKMINIHPALYKYPGHNPIKRYIENKDMLGSVESQWLIEDVDGGETIHQEYFVTPICQTHADFYNIAFKYYLECMDKTLKKICG